MNTKSILAFAAITVALALLVSPILATDADAKSKQSIKQKNKASSSGQCTAGVTLTASCTSTTGQANTNSGFNIFASQD